MAVVTSLYPALKLLHVSCAVISIGGFTLRGIWALRGSAMLQRRWVRIAPHVVDTVFLLSGVALMLIVRQYPGAHGWLTAKIAGLLAYIVLGTLTLKHARTLRARVVLLGLSLAVFSWIVSVALTRHPAGLLGAFV